MTNVFQNPLNWGNEEADNQSVKQMTQQAYELDLAYFECFRTRAGKTVLDHLVKNTLDASTWLSSLDYNRAIAHGFAREGQNALVRNIKDRIERGRTAKNKPTEG